MKALVFSLLAAGTLAVASCGCNNTKAVPGENDGVVIEEVQVETAVDTTAAPAATTPGQ